ncbi:MAG: 2'-5' RNA ligase family protein [Bifidobacteriaceae bacterium]|jgi:2'-5' RNA ligase|nr:2'-5' RNA ligase family protein [Bifidobacteriaceae bacterium]
MVPDPLAGQLRQAQRQFGCTDTSPPHITLIPPSAVDQAQLDNLVKDVRRRAEGFKAFRIRLQGVDTFRPVTPVVFAKLADGFEACCQLERLIRPAIPGFEDRFPYHPHLTLAHGDCQATLNQAESLWQSVDEAFTAATFSLTRIVSEREWQLLAEVQLDPGNSPAPQPATQVDDAAADLSAEARPPSGWAGEQPGQQAPQQPERTDRSAGARSAEHQGDQS